MSFEIEVTMPGGSAKRAVVIGKDSDTVVVLRFGPMQPLYPFNLKTGEGRGKLREWRLSEQARADIRKHFAGERR